MIALMSESPQITALRKTLSSEPSYEAYPPPRRKHMAEICLEQILKAIDRGMIPLGTWEQLCIESALTCLQQGQYHQARVNAVAALRAVDERATNLETVPMRTIEALRRDFEVVRLRPVMER